MYKRRDWLFTHGADGGGDDTSSDSSSSSSGDASEQSDGSDANEEVSSEEQPSSSEEEEEEEAPTGKTARTQPSKQRVPPPSKPGKARKADSIRADSISDNSSESESESEEERREEEVEIDSDNDAALYARRLEDLSEDDLDDGLEGEDYESEDEEKEQQLAMQLESWANAKEGSKGVRGKALKCVLCDGALVLNAVVLHNHMDSKKHKKQLAVVAKDGHTDLALHEVFCYAEDYDAAEKEEEQETYYERMQRVDEALAKAKTAAALAAAEKKEKLAGADGKSGASKKDMKRRAARMEKRKKSGKEVKKRPGKRQRQALKDSGEGKAAKKGKKLKE